MNKKTFISLISIGLLSTSIANADEIRLSPASSTVGQSKHFALNAGVSATLNWGNGQTETITFNGGLASVVVKSTSLTITTAGNGDITSLYASGWGLTNAEMTATPNLQRLDLSFNALSSINVATVTNLLELNVRDNQLNSLDISPLTKLQVLNCANNQITSLALNSNSLTTVVASGNNLTTLANVGNSVQVLWANDNLLTNVTLSQPASIRTLAVHNNQLAELPASMSGIKKLSVSGNNLTFSKLPTVYSGGNAIIDSWIEAQNGINVATVLKVNEALNLSTYFATNANGVNTNASYVVKRQSDNTTLSASDVSINNGMLTFLQEVGEVYVEVTSEQYPDVKLVTLPFRVSNNTSIEETKQASDVQISATQGRISVTSNKKFTLIVSKLNGVVVVKQQIEAGTTDFVLPQGIYVIAGKKVLVP